MDNINESNSKLSYEELLEQNTQLKKQIKEIEEKSKKVEDKNLYTEKSRQTIEKLSNSGSWEIDLINIKQTWSENYCFLLGYEKKIDTPDEQLFLSHVYPKDLDMVKTAMQKSMEEQRPTELEFRYIPKDGTIRYARSKAEYIFDEKNDTTKIIGSFQDITENKRIEEQYKILFENLIDEVHYWKVIKDKNGEIKTWELVDANKSALKAWNKTKEQVIGKTTNEIFNSDAQKLFMPIVQKIFKTGKSFSWETYFPATNQYLSMDSIPLGEFFISTGKDITIRKKKELELLKAKEKAEFNERELNKVQEITHIGSWSLDVATNEVVWTKELYKMYGFDPAQPVPPYTEHMKLFTTESWELLSESLEQTRESGIPYELELRTIKKDGSNGWMWVRGEAIQKNGVTVKLWGAAQDITERKLDEEALRSSQEMLLTSQSVANICSYSTNLLVTDIDKSHWECSPEFYKIFGIDETYPHTIKGWIGFLHPDYREDVAAYHESVVLEKKSFNREYKIIRINDGVERWVHGTGELVYDEKGNPIRMYGAIQDITEHKLAELALKESENKFKTLFKDNNSIQLLIAPSTGNIIDANQAACDFYGYAYEKLTALSIQDINQSSEEEVKREMNSAKEKKRNYFEFEHKLKDGTIREVEVFSNPITIDNVQYLISIIHDVTTKKRAERELINAKEKAEESEKILKTTLQTAMDGYWVVDMNGCFLNVNDTYCSMSGYNREDIVDMCISDVEAIQSPEEIIKNIQRIKQIGQLRFETKHVRKDGTLYDVEVGVQYQESNDGQFVCFIKDITEQKKHEAELLLAKEKAEHSDRLKSAFLTNMSHEIRTPMNGILGFTTLLQNSNLSVENHKEYIDIIEKSGNRLLNTVNDIIEISKIESGEIKLTKSEVDIIGHLNTLVTFFKPEAKKKNIDIIVENNIDKNDLTIATDKNKLSSILSNLIKNAIKYTNEGTINVGLKDENNEILFSCQDTGIGIPKNRQEAIFNRFEQADIEDKQVHEGSGLGLAIVKSYVEMLNGKIWVESEEGKGSVFYVSLPYKHEKKKEQIGPKEVKPSNSGIKNVNVLVVEDDSISSMHLSAILNGRVKNIISVKNGIEAIDACKKDPDIDLILMDLKMPVMDGITATKKIREFNKEVIIIAQTAYALEGDKEKALNAGCNDYISKPIKKDKLFELINKYF